jgi:hypothetical protein
VADQAVNVAVHGDQNRIEITSAQASGNGSHQVHAGHGTRTGSRGTLWAAVGSLAGVAAVIVAVFTWQGWWT